MLRRVFLGMALALGVVWAGLPAAAGAEQRAELLEALRLPELIEIMRSEGLDHGAEIGESLLGPRDGPGWAATVAAIYGRERMLGIMTERLEVELASAEAEVAAMLGFFASGQGQRLVELEISARRAMLDPEIEAAARDRWAEMAEDGGDRVEALRRFADVADLIEANVVGGLNSTYAFYIGLMDGELRGGWVGRGEVLADVMAQEPEIRAEIEEWLFAYLSLAYGPVGAADLDAYIAFFETPAGERLNVALFAAFHEMFETLSRDLGLAAGRILMAEDI